jgi:integrase
LIHKGPCLAAHPCLPALWSPWDGSTSTRRGALIAYRDESYFDAGIPTGTLHTLRHTAATLALTAGVPVHIVAARLGGDPKTILGTYAHLLSQSDELAAERVTAPFTTG